MDKVTFVSMQSFHCIYRDTININGLTTEYASLQEKDLLRTGLRRLYQSSLAKVSNTGRFRFADATGAAGIRTAGVPA